MRTSIPTSLTFEALLMEGKDWEWLDTGCDEIVGFVTVGRDFYEVHGITSTSNQPKVWKFAGVAVREMQAVHDNISDGTWERVPTPFAAIPPMVIITKEEELP